jgi:hypothetical protein
MRSDATASPTKPVIKFPMLMIDKQDGMIVLATAIIDGCLHCSIVHLRQVPSYASEWCIGYHTRGMNPLTFVPYTGTITLQND